MHSTDGNQSPSDRRSSVRRSRRLSANIVADDEYDLMAGAVSDGFRPSAGVPSQPTSQTPPQPSQLPVQRRNPASPVMPRFPAPTATAPLKGFAEFNRPSSTSKPLRAHDSLTLRTDGSGVNGAPQSMVGSTSRQANGNSAAYQGPTQPSHPYQMYPQRTFSNATGSTGQNAERQSIDSMPRGPTHPYLLYAQNAAAHSNANPPQQIPVGFNGLGNSYQRQIGPDGEEAGDLIGPLGHMEELPPYSRYPQEAYQPKPEAAGDDSNTAAAGTSHIGASVATPTTPTAPQAIPGAGGIGLATRNPEFSSSEDLPGTLQRSRPSFRSATSSDSQHDVNGAARDFDEKQQPNKWQRRAKKKLWGIVPYWAICLLMVGMILMGIIMGAVIGTIVSRHGSRRGKGDGQFDHAPPRRPNNIQDLPALPPDLPELTTGYFALPPMDKYQVPKACIKDSSQSPAWSCDMPFRWYSVTVSRLHTGPPTKNYALNLTPFNRNTSKFIWGTQPPSIQDAEPLKLVKDPDEMNRGPAWFLETNYTKAVVLPKNSLQRPPSESKRDSYVSLPEGSFNVNRFKQKMKTAVEGDEIWYCTWPDTQFQVFIYPNQTFSTPTTSVMPDGTPATPTPSADATGYGGQEIKPPNTKSPYPKLVKFVERRQYTNNFVPASCSLQKVINSGCSSEPVKDDDGRPIVINIAEISKPAMVPLADRSVGDGAFSELHSRDVELTPCGCVSFSWNV